YNDLIRVKRRCDLGDAVAELANEEIFFVLETCNLPLDGSREFGIIQLLVPEQCQRMHLDVIIDDKFLSRETHTFVRQVRELKAHRWRCHVQHQWCPDLRQRIEIVFLSFIFYVAGIDESYLSFRTTDGYIHSISENIGSISATYNRGHTELPGNNRSVTGSSTFILHDSGSFFHDRFPIGVCHVCDKQIAFAKFISFN